MYKKKVFLAAIVFVIMLSVAVAINFPEETDKPAKDYKENSVERVEKEKDIKNQEKEEKTEEDAPYKTMTWDEFVKEKHAEDLGGGEE